LVRRLRIAAIVAAVAIAFADSAIVVLALPELLRDYDVSINAVAWVVTAYNLALAAAALVVGRRLALAGAVVFAVASVVCGAAPDVWVLIAFRTVQGVAAAALLVGALPILSALSPQRGATLWASAGVFGAAVGPALGGALTDVFSWRAIFYAQAPVAALGAIALVGLRPDPVAERKWPLGLASAALALVSAALVGLLFLAVVQLVDVWRFSPLGAGAIVSAIPIATLASAPLAARAGTAAIAPGALLLAGGLAGIAFLPATSIAWFVASLAVAGAGFGLAVPGLTQAGPGARTVAIRHAGLVVGLVVVTPLLTTDLIKAGEKAELRGVATVLDAPVGASGKLRLAIDLAPVLAEPARKELPSFSKALAGEHDPAVARMGRTLDDVVQATVTRGFRGSFLVAAAFAFVAGVLLVRRARAAAAAALVAAALIGAELGSGALSYGKRPKLYPPCATREETAAVAALDFVACRFHKSREQFAVDAAAAGVSAVAFVQQIERLGALFRP
jgi:MFS family permease